MVKVAFVLFAVVGVALCAPEATLRRAKLTREFGRQEIAIANAVDSDLPEVVVTSEIPQPKSAPYPAAGFRPERAFILPTEDADDFNPEAKAEEIAPAQEYGAPDQEYGPPIADDDFDGNGDEETIPESERLSLDTAFLRPNFNIRSEKLQAIRAPRPAQQQFAAQPMLYYSPGQGFVYTNPYQNW